MKEITITFQLSISTFHEIPYLVILFHKTIKTKTIFPYLVNLNLINNQQSVKDICILPELIPRLCSTITDSRISLPP
jgi:hypothetical protein